VIRVAVVVDYLRLCVASTYVIIGNMMSMESTKVEEKMVPEDCVAMMEC
jgi:hypothetical protein